MLPLRLTSAWVRNVVLFVAQLARARAGHAGAAAGHGPRAAWMQAGRVLACVLLAGVLAPRGGAAAESAGDWSQGYALVVLEEGADLQAARRLVQAEGGTVALLLEPRLLTGWIPPELDAALVGRAGIRAVERQVPVSGVDELGDDAATRAGRRFFDRAVRGELAAAGAASKTAAAMGPPDARDREGIADADILANLRGLEPERRARLGVDLEALGGVQQSAARKSGGGASLASNSDFMTGVVSVTLFFVESDGSSTDPDLYDWTAKAEQAVFDEAAAGLSWWVAQARRHSGCWVVFQLQAHFATQDARCTQWREPLLHSSTDFGAAVQQVLGNFGYTSGSHLARAAAFDLEQRLTQHADWAYCSFVAANPSGPKSFTDGYAAWAYIGGPYVALLQRSFDWPFRQVFAHETAHMFRACDEYYTPGYGGCTSCGGCGDTGVENGNCEQCNAHAETCMMRSNAWSLCNWTAGQIGWWRTPCVDQQIAAPSLDTATPSILVQGQEDDIELQGQNLISGMTASLGSGVQAVSTQLVTDTQLVVRVRVDVDATPGARDIVLTAPDGQTAQLRDGLQVRDTTRHYVSSVGGDVFPFDAPEYAARDLSSALAACSRGDTLLLVGGTYAPFKVTKTITVQGGWADDFGSRLPVARPSIVQGAGSGPALTITGASASPIVDGLVLRGGAGKSMLASDLGTVFAGGGLLCLDAAPTLRRCVIEGNRCGAGTTPGVGGGAFFWHARPRLEECTVRGNSAARGAGLFFLESSASLARNRIEDNEADAANGAPAWGAGIAALRADLDLDGDAVHGNRGAAEGGGVHLESCARVRLVAARIDSNTAAQGGGVQARDTHLMLVGCEVTRNRGGDRGGGLCASGDSLDLESTLVAGNEAAILGGGLFVSNAVPSLRNVTLARNNGGPASGAYFENAPAAGSVRSCILAENVLGGLAVVGGVLPVLDWNVYWGNGNANLVSVTAGEHDLESNPRFARADSLDLHLGLLSPGIDSGDPAPAWCDPDGSRNDRGAHGGPQALAPPPSRVLGLQAMRAGSAVRLTWNPSRDADARIYAVWRDTTSAWSPSAGSYLGYVAAPATSFTDAHPRQAARYVVSVLDASGHAGGYAEPVGVSTPADAAPRPREALLHAIFPNPSNPGVWVQFDLPQPMPVQLAVYEATGRRVRLLLAGNLGTGTNRAYWDGRDDAGREVASGIYWMRLLAGGRQHVRRLALVR